MTTMSDRKTILDRTTDTLAATGAFLSVENTEAGIRADAREVESEVYYKVWEQDGRLYVGLFTPDRWLSESIEADLMFKGDKLEELLEDELIDQGYEGPVPAFEHFRDDEKIYVFRSPLPEDAAGDAETLAKVLLAYEATFHQLGDMSEDEGAV